MAKRRILNAPDTLHGQDRDRPGLPDQLVDLRCRAEENLKRLAKANGWRSRTVPAFSTAAAQRADRAGSRDRARIMLISDGDVSAVISTARPTDGVDIYIAAGGAPRRAGRAALRCHRRQMQGRCCSAMTRKGPARRLGITDFNRQIFHAGTGQGRLMSRRPASRWHHLRACGAARHRDHPLMVMRSIGTVRVVEAQHNWRSSRTCKPPPSMTEAAPYLGVAKSLCGRFWLERQATSGWASPSRNAARCRN